MSSDLCKLKFFVTCKKHETRFLSKTLVLKYVKTSKTFLSEVLFLLKLQKFLRSITQNNFYA